MGGESHQREVDVQPYIICQGDYLLKLAYKFDFDPDGVWNDPSNADLRQLRPDPNMLLATDQLNIPDQVDKVPVTYELSTGQTNSFVAQSQLVTVSVRFTSCLCFTCDGQPLQGEAYEVEGADIDRGTLDGDGNFVATIPTTVQQFVVKLTGRKENYVVKVGHLDPPATLSGAWQRLAMLGFVDSPTVEEQGGDGDDNGLTLDVRYTLWDFQRAHSLPMTADLDEATVNKLVERVGR